MTDMHHAGDRRLRLAANETGTAIFGGALRQYRYRLGRDLGLWSGTVLWVMTNPSTADDMSNDMTVAKVSRISRRLGFRHLLVGNTFAYRATDQRRLLEVEDPVGPDNDRHLLAMAGEAALVIFAYGVPAKPLRARGPEVARLILGKLGRTPMVLGLTKDGIPRHPLYMPDNSTPVEWHLPT